MGLKGEVAFRLSEPEYRKENAKEFRVGFLVVLGTFDQRAERFSSPTEDRFRVGNDERADACTKNDYEFDRLPQNSKIAVNGIPP